MEKLLEIYEETQLALEYIRKELKRVSPYMNNCRTIEQSNVLFFMYLDNFKREAFKKLDYSLVKPFVIYQVNSYYSCYTHPREKLNLEMTK